MYISRQAEQALKKLSHMFGAVLITGPRQVGKTTMMQHAVSGISHVTLDDPLLLVNAVEQSMTFFKDNPPPVFLDEVQKAAPELFPLIKLHIDKS